jgi:hypothetical protein
VNIDLSGPKWTVTVTFVPVHIVSGLTDTILIWDLTERTDNNIRHVKSAFLIKNDLDYLKTKYSRQIKSHSMLKVQTVLTVQSV